jgi:hypothetical protein
VNVPASQASEHLNARIETLLAAVGQLEGLLTHTWEAGKSLPSRDELSVIARRHEPVLAKMLEPVRRELMALRESADSNIADRWSRTKWCAQQLEQLSAELLPVAEGALARAAGLDNGLCSMAQRLLDDLGTMTVPWNRIVIPAPHEATSNRSWVVGLPLLDASLWHLPIMVHELGHYAATRLEDQYNRRLGAELLDGSWRKRPDVSSMRPEMLIVLSYKHAQELFADVFGAYCAGPAFAASLMTRAIPADVLAASPDHPSWGVRMHATLRALSRLGDLVPEVRGNLSWITGWIAEEWESAQGLAGRTEIPIALRATVDAFTDGAIDVMGLTGSTALFRGEGVLETGELLREGVPPDRKVDLRTVLNAAWAERLRDREKIARIECALAQWRMAAPGRSVVSADSDGAR